MLSCEAQGRSRNEDASDETALFVRGRAMLAIRLVIWFYSCITKIVEQSIVSVMPMIE